MEPDLYHVSKASKSPIYSVAISGGSYTVVMGLLDILGTQAQVGARPKKMEMDAQDASGLRFR